ncbi:TolC family protein [Loktanella sp. IMCC34160]|uniref:TolC family protein n=1 Tax=Loktanella sp. IMCC34160 TaxID=2510646 RepID=UPI00101D9A31|nr:TolC family protein [Loktanella sp. IMCC34160]RYG91789.1 TolC family protein [Loktanella sp. IMCC34160]
MRQGQRILRAGVAGAALLALAGCMSDGGGTVSRGAFGFLGGSDSTAPTDQPTQAMTADLGDGSQSVLIEGLIDRRSVLSPGPLQTVTDAVLAANSRAAEAELRAARLRAEAQSRNWLPTLGPSISLNSLGQVVTSLFVEQVLFDNGRKRAERDFAKADVEVAAVALAEDTNDRVRQALDLYLTAEAHRARAAVNAAAMERMEHFEYVMRERVRGGVSDRSDLNVVTQKLNQLRADLAADQDAANTAMAELSAMSAQPLAGLSGLSPMADPAGLRPLAAVKADAEATRAMASADAARAGFLPGLTLGGTVTGDGNNLGLNVAAPNGFGFGTGASLQAIEAERAASQARIGQVEEDTNRRLRALEGQLASLLRQEDQARTLAAQAAANYDIFAAQLAEGQRAVPEVVGIFETKIRTEREAVVVAYDIARIRVQIAAIHGALVDGSRI